jgi:hypothetical protein
VTDIVGSYLKKHSEALVKDVGVEAAARATGKSKASLGRYYSADPEHAARFMPVDVVARLEAVAQFPHMTGALAELRGITLSYGAERQNAQRGGFNADVIMLSQRFAILMAEYHQSIADGKITLNEAKRLLAETQAIQQVLLDMKFHLEHGAQ